MVTETLSRTGVRAAVDWLFIRVQNSRRRCVLFCWGFVLSDMLCTGTSKATNSLSQSTSPWGRPIMCTRSVTGRYIYDRTLFQISSVLYGHIMSLSCGSIHIRWDGQNEAMIVAVLHESIIGCMRIAQAPMKLRPTATRCTSHPWYRVHCSGQRQVGRTSVYSTRP